MRKIGTLVLASLLLSGCSFNGVINQHTDEESGKEKQESVKKKAPVKKKPKYARKVVNGITYINGIMIVNKKIGLPKNYSPGINRNAKMHLDKLIQDGNKHNLHFVLRSAFRSYQEQANLYHNYVARDGKKAADLYSAEPGHSEHQTGLAFDLGSVASTNDFTVTFGTTPEGHWLKDNAHKYGFIIRYGKGKTKITGYQYEPWHIRYVGKKTAMKLYRSHQTLEEYLGLYPVNRTKLVK